MSTLLVTVKTFFARIPALFLRASQFGRVGLPSFDNKVTVNRNGNFLQVSFHGLKNKSLIKITHQDLVRQSTVQELRGNIIDSSKKRGSERATKTMGVSSCPVFLTQIYMAKHNGGQ